MKFYITCLFAGILAIQACTQSKKDGLSHAQSVRLEQYLVEGQRLYIQYCSNCHQQEGKGLARLFPPLKDSDFLINNFTESICAMKFGLEGDITVNGVVYNQVMPPIPTLTELEIAEISTYIYNTWTEKKGIVTIDTVRQALKACKP